MSTPDTQGRGKGKGKGRGGGGQRAPTTAAAVLPLASPRLAAHVCMISDVPLRSRICTPHAGASVHSRAHLQFDSRFDESGFAAQVLPKRNSPSSVEKRTCVTSGDGGEPECRQPQRTNVLDDPVASASAQSLAHAAAAPHAPARTHASSCALCTLCGSLIVLTPCVWQLTDVTFDSLPINVASKRALREVLG
jgi:hypothetical protein